MTPIEWARGESELLKEYSRDREKPLTGGMNSVAHELSPALEFLRVHAGGSEFYGQAQEVINSNRGAGAGVFLIGYLLGAWADWVDTGLGSPETFAVRARVEAATDLMEQVQRLLDDRAGHPAAPVMLAGAALEELLRAEVARADAKVKGKPGLNSYATALRTAEAITSQDVKDITAWAGQRNAAAHGQFDLLSRERAALLADQINLFMRQRAAAAAGASEG